MTISFFGGGPGAPHRVVLLPSLLTNTFSPNHGGAWQALGLEFSSMPRMSQRVWWWLALTLLTESTNVSDCLTRFAPALRRSDGSKGHWIDATEIGQGKRIDRLWLSQQCGALFGRTAEPFRSGGVRFGVAANGKSDLAFCIDPDAVPELIEDWSEFATRHGDVPDGVLVAFRQLVLIHPFRDGNGRLARMVVAQLSESCGLPRLLMMPALAMFRARNDHERAAYSAAFASSDASVFSRFVLDRTTCLLSTIRQLSPRIERAATDGLQQATPGSFPSLLNRRLLEWPVVTVEELSRIGRCSSRNVHRWCDTYAGSESFSFDGSQLVWRSLLENLDQVEPGFWAAVRDSF